MNLKRFNPVTGGIALALALALPAFAQSSSSVNTTASVKIIQPINIGKTADLSFGTVIIPTSGINTISLTPAGVRTMGGPGAGGFGAGSSGPAGYLVSGEGGYSFSVSVPTTATMSKAGGPGIQVTLTPSITTGQLSGSPGTGGSLAFGVGGSFQVDSTTSTGSYSGTYDVTVSYN